MRRDARFGRRPSERPLYQSVTSNPLYQNKTSPCRDARSVRPLYQRLQHRGFNGDGRTDRASLQGDVGGGRSNVFNGDGRTSRASLQGVVGDAVMFLTGTDGPVYSIVSW